MKYLSAAFLSFIFLVSCDSKSDNKEQVVAPSVSPVSTDQILPVTNDSAAAAFKADVALNPQHGQPGHRCDIAVGAPLNASTTSIESNVSASTPPITTNTTTNTNTNAKSASPQLNTATTALNPKHGEPGHRCDIEVGAPLNSKPTQ